MSSLKQFQIYLESPVAVYYSGQTVSGQIAVELTRPKKLRGIQLRIKGEANVHWTERETRHTAGNNRQHRTVSYSAHESYFSLEHYVSGGSAAGETLPAGFHTFPFHVVLPHGLPSSFEGPYGYVRYTVKAVIQRPWKFDHEAKVLFTVIQPLDLNAEFQCHQPIQMSTEKYTGCCCCRSGPLHLVTNLPVTGYVPGQEIPLATMVDNATNQKIDVVTYLQQNVHFHANTKSRAAEIKVCEVKVGSVSRRGSGQWDYRLQIPSLPPSYLKSCSIIDISYKLIVKASISGPHRSLVEEVPIVIGTIPLTSFVRPAPPTQILIQPSAPMEPPPPNPQNLGINPPTYEECMQGKIEVQDPEDNEYTRGDAKFVPRYPTYKFNG